MADIVFKYFTNLSTLQRTQIKQLKELYSIWNSKVNLISRKDFDHFYERHVLHSLAISKFYSIDEGTKVLDFGTGGGFPGIPLAIILPKCSFQLVDSIGKKINVVKNIITSLDLNNTQAKACRVEDLDDSFDIIVGRAVKNLPQILTWTTPLLNKNSKKQIKGLIYLKGGDFEEELTQQNSHYEIKNISEKYSEPYFETKKIIRFY